jgi:hypothetical protein
MFENSDLPVLAANPQATMPTPVAALTSAALPEEISHLAQAQTLLAHLPETLRQQASCFTGATGIIGCLFFSKQPDILAQQEKIIPSAALLVAQELRQWLSLQSEEGVRYRLIWLELALPVLREALDTERQQLLVMTKDLVSADGRISPTEFAIYSLLRVALLPPSLRRIKRSELRLEQLDSDIADVLALLAYAGHEDDKTAKAAYLAAIDSSPVDTKHSFPEKSGLSLHRISEALSHLALASPPYRKKILHACKLAVHYDGKITPVENELLAAFAQSLDCPAPLV